MPKLKLRVRPRPKAPEPPKEVSIEEARDRYQFGTKERAVAELQEFSRHKDVAREANNAQNRAKTQAGKAMKALVTDAELAIGDEIQIGEEAFAWDYAREDVIDPKGFYELFQKGKITEDDFFKSLSVLKSVATTRIGEHILGDITSETVGKTADIRVRKLDNPVKTPRIVKRPPPRAKKKLDRSTDIAPAVANVNNPVRSLRRRRNINAGRTR